MFQGGKRSKNLKNPKNPKNFKTFAIFLDFYGGKLLRHWHSFLNAIYSPINAGDNGLNSMPHSPNGGGKITRKSSSLKERQQGGHPGRRSGHTTPGTPSLSRQSLVTGQDNNLLNHSLSTPGSPNCTDDGGFRQNVSKKPVKTAENGLSWSKAGIFCLKRQFWWILGNFWKIFAVFLYLSTFNLTNLTLEILFDKRVGHNWFGNKIFGPTSTHR